MFAVIKTGGKQYRVAQNDLIRVERLAGDAGDTVSFAEVLLVGDGEQATVGTPTVAGASVAGTLVEQIQADKVVIFKKKRRHNYRRKKGHRQELSLVRITEIALAGAQKPARAPRRRRAAATPAAEESAAAAASEG